MAREFLMIVTESAYKVPTATPTIWTTSTSYGLSHYQGAYIRLDGGNAFTMRPRPSGTVTVPYGGGFAVPAYMTSDKQECVGQLTLKLTVGLAPLLLSWAGVRISGSGTAPWTTSIIDGDLPSCAVYHAVTRGADNTIKRRVYLGTKVSSWALTVSESSTIATLTLNLVASTPQGNTFDSSPDPSSGTFPAPPTTTWPSIPSCSCMRVGPTSSHSAALFARSLKSSRSTSRTSSPAVGLRTGI